MFVKLLDMSSFFSQPVRRLSLGQKMRCELAAAFLHGPKIVFLDEPTIGLDVVAKDRIRQFLKEVNNSLGTTIILTTHDLVDVERVCHLLLMITYVLVARLVDTLTWAEIGGKVAYHIRTGKIGTVLLKPISFKKVLFAENLGEGAVKSAFWIVRHKSMTEFIVWFLREFADYPVSIYLRALQIILTFVLPYAFINFFPAQYFLQKNDFLLFHPLIQYLSPAVGAIMFAIAVVFWKIGLRHYQSTGS